MITYCVVCDLHTLRKHEWHSCDNRDIDGGKKDDTNGTLLVHRQNKKNQTAARVHILLLERSNRLLGSIIEIVGGDNFDVAGLGGLGDHGLGLFNIGAGEADNEGQLEVDLLGSADDTRGYRVALHDTTENVDKDGLDLLVRSDDLEGLLDGRLSGTTTNIEEVGGAAAIELDDVHCGHGKTSTVHCTKASAHEKMKEKVCDNAPRQPISPSMPT